jgi:hypothetical protein
LRLLACDNQENGNDGGYTDDYPQGSYTLLTAPKDNN